MNTKVLTTPWRSAIVFSFLLCACGASSMGGEMVGPEKSLITLAKPDGCFVALSCAASDREMNFSSRITPIELSRVTASAGIDLLSFLSLRAEAGTTKATVGVIESSGGFEWGVGARAALWDYVIDGTPVIPRRQTVRVEVDVAYHEADMKIDGVYFGPQFGNPSYGLATVDDYLTWTELTISPLIRYTHNRAIESVWNHRLPTGVSAYIGPYYSDWDLKHAPLKGSGNHDLGLRVGSDLRIANGWLIQLDAILYDGSDHRYTVGMGYYF